jgi:hypothetical protein
MLCGEYCCTGIPCEIPIRRGVCGQIDRETLAEFCEAIADYPDFLQDTLLVIAHAQGFGAAADALDSAVREQLGARDAGGPLMLLRGAVKG